MLGDAVDIIRKTCFLLYLLTPNQRNVNSMFNHGPQVTETPEDKAVNNDGFK